MGRVFIDLIDGHRQQKSKCKENSYLDWLTIALQQLYIHE